MENNDSKQNPSAASLLDRITDELSDAGSDLITTDGLATQALETFELALEETTHDGQESITHEQVHLTRNAARNALKELRRLKETLANLEETLRDIKDAAQDRLDS